MSNPTFTQIAFWQAMLKEHFVLYVLYGFGVREYCNANPQDNWWDDEIHWKICESISDEVKRWEQSRRKGIRQPFKLALIIPRGWGKSTIGSALDQWLQLRNPDMACVISSYDEAKAEEFAGVTKTVFEGGNQYGWFKELYGIWSPGEGEKHSWKKSYFTHTHRRNRAIRDPSFAIASVATGLTGGRPDYFRTDDLIVKEKMAKQGNWIQRARDHNKSAKYAVKTNGLFVACLTKYSDHDVGTQIMLEEGVREFAPYGMRPRDEHSYKMGGSWYVIFFSAEDETGTKATMPRIWPWERLKEIEEEDPFQYACQMLNEPGAAANSELKRKHIDSMWVNFGDINIKNCTHVLNLDTAFKYPEQRERGDYNVIMHWALDTQLGIATFLGAKRNNTWNSKEFMDALIQELIMLDARDQYPSVITDERMGVGQKEQAFEQFLYGECRKHNLPIPNYLALKRAGTPGTSNQKDDLRVKNAVYAWLSGKVRLLRGAENVEAFVDEMLRIGISRNDDLRDAGADIFNPLVYRPFVGLEMPDSQPQTARPLDELLYVPAHQWGDEEMRKMYDQYKVDQELAEMELTDEGMNSWVTELYH